MKILFGRLIWFVALVAIIGSCHSAFSQGLQLIGSCAFEANPNRTIRTVWVSGNYAYITSLNEANLLTVVDISDPYNPTVAAIYDTLFIGAQDICADNNYAYLGYVGGDGGGLAIIDISNPQEPHLISIVCGGWQCHRLYKQKNFVYLANCIAGLNIIDVSDPHNPFIAGNCPAPFGESQGIYVDGSLAYLIDWDGFSIIDVHDGSSPRLISQMRVPDNYHIDVRTSGDYAYVINDAWFNFIRIINVSDNDHPQLTDTLRIRHSPLHNLFLSAPYLFLSHDFISVFDISDPIHPQMVAAFNDTTGNRRTRDIYYENGLVYAVTDSFLLIFQFTPTGIEDEDILKPATLSLLPNYPNPFNLQTSIEYSLPSPSRIDLEIYDIQGHKITTLFSGLSSAGNHKAVWNAGNCSSGIYFVRLADGKSSVTKKITLLK